MEALTKAGCTLIILDHHDCEDEVILYDNGMKLDYNEYRKDKDKLKSLMQKTGVGIYINNQYPKENEKSRYLSGAGVTYEAFAQFIAKYMPAMTKSWETQEQRGLVGWTLLSDMRDISGQDAKLYLQELYTYPDENKAGTNVKCDILGMLKKLRKSIRDSNPFEREKFGKIRLDRIAMDFHITPLMNANFRFDNGDDVIKYLWGDANNLDMQAHKNQKELRKTMEEVIDETGNGQYYGDNNNLYVFGIDEDNPKIKGLNTDISNFIGLVCNNKRNGCSVIGYVTKNGKLKRASFRGRLACDYKDKLNEAGYLDGAGHQGAFGIRSMELSQTAFEGIAKICAELEKDQNPITHPIIEVNNLGRFCEGNNLYKSGGISDAYKVAYSNMFIEEDKKICIKYTGSVNRVSGEWNSAKTRCRYNVDGRYVTCYDYPTTPQTGLICPMLEDGVIEFTLRKM